MKCAIHRHSTQGQFPVRLPLNHRHDNRFQLRNLYRNQHIRAHQMDDADEWLERRKIGNVISVSNLWRGIVARSLFIHSFIRSHFECWLRHKFFERISVISNRLLCADEKSAEKNGRDEKNETANSHKRWINIRSKRLILCCVVLCCFLDMQTSKSHLHNNRRWFVLGGRHTTWPQLGMGWVG